mmetsp:Transcript_3055/g.11081  ORF Transcript_3055/g.11081 Transcript_3055/m.11081 type:complete len:436 (+) Transcript_3055:7313-8620(+)
MKAGSSSAAGDAPSSYGPPPSASAGVSSAASLGGGLSRAFSHAVASSRSTPRIITESLRRPVHEKATGSPSAGGSASSSSGRSVLDNPSPAATERATSASPATEHLSESIMKPPGALAAKATNASANISSGRMAPSGSGGASSAAGGAASSGVSDPSAGASTPTSSSAADAAAAASSPAGSSEASTPSSAASSAPSISAASSGSAGSGKSSSPSSSRSLLARGMSPMSAALTAWSAVINGSWYFSAILVASVVLPEVGGPMMTTLTELSGSAASSSISPTCASSSSSSSGSSSGGSSPASMAAARASASSFAFASFASAFARCFASASLRSRYVLAIGPHIEFPGVRGGSRSASPSSATYPSAERNISSSSRNCLSVSRQKTSMGTIDSLTSVTTAVFGASDLGRIGARSMIGGSKRTESTWVVARHESIVSLLL